MGSPVDEQGRRPDEGPVSVTLSRGYWIGTYEVTQADWRRIMGPLPGPAEAGEGGTMPVYWVGFIAAEEFCRRLTTTASDEVPPGWEFRLPTEDSRQRRHVLTLDNNHMATAIPTRLSKIKT